MVCLQTAMLYFIYSTHYDRSRVRSGCLLTEQASFYAQDTYSTPDVNGHKYMYFASVLTGEYTQGAQGIVVPPPKDPQKDRNVLFDSVVDNVSNPTIFVVFSDSQAYPEYLITFCKL